MKSKILLPLLLFFLVIIVTKGTSQNIYSLERVQIVGSFNGYTTTPYGTDYRTTTYRTVSVATGNPTDGRGQWATTINVAATGGDVQPVNMLGGGGAGGGFLFISGPTATPYNNKWVFNGVMQATLDGVSTAVYGGTTDMGLNMATAGYYTFVMNDYGYSASPNTQFYVGRTDSVPANITVTSQKINSDNSVFVFVSLDRKPSDQENFYLRYVTGGSDFSGAVTTSIIKGQSSDPNDTTHLTGSKTTGYFKIPAPSTSTVVKYYVFSSTRSLIDLNNASELAKSISVLRYDDNNHANYNASVVLPINLQFFTGTSNNEAISLNWKTNAEINANNFNIEKLANNSTWNTIGTVAAQNIGGSSYTFIDNAPDNGSNTYRLKLVDKDGTSNYSAAITINAQVTSGLKLYPTLVNSNSINIVFNEQKAGKATIKLTALNGKVLQQNTVNVNDGNMVLQHTLPLLTKGNYVVTVSTAKSQKTFTIVVQ
ncbi:T9SS type A sorting domain-containing protein [Parasediminibacterium paludis]|uniref:T9SS type A sorting domain-containing protein n=1 Tax=Parasediminibacterium paludis TaxID=908966 RepID=A0ABV8PZV3_9BACT